MATIRLVIVFGLLALQTSSLLGQGQIEFANRNPSGGVDAPVTYLDGTPVSGGFTAQLFAGPFGTPVSALLPLEPTTVFRTGVAAGYVQSVTVTMTPDLSNIDLSVVMRVFDGPNWESSVCRGESASISLVPSNPLGNPRALSGLRSFQVNCVPEPRLLALFGIVGLGLASVQRRDLRAFSCG